MDLLNNFETIKYPVVLHGIVHNLDVDWGVDVGVHFLGVCVNSEDLRKKMADFQEKYETAVYYEEEEYQEGNSVSFSYSNINETCEIEHVIYIE